MKFYDPFKVVDHTGSLSLVTCIVLAIIILLTVFALSLLTYPVITIKVTVAIVVSRILYAIIKGA